MNSKQITLLVNVATFLGLCTGFYYMFDNNILDCGRNGEPEQMLAACILYAFIVQAFAVGTVISLIVLGDKK